MQERLVRENGARLLPGRHDHRRAVLERGEKIAKRVSCAGARMKIHDSGIARGLRVAVRHGHDRRFLQAKDIVEVIGEIAEHRELC